MARKSLVSPRTQFVVFGLLTIAVYCVNAVAIKRVVKNVVRVELYSKVKKSSTDKAKTHQIKPFEKYRKLGSGSGMIVTRENQLLTNKHSVVTVSRGDPENDSGLMLSQINSLHQKIWIWGAISIILFAVVLILILRKPRARVIKVVGDMVGTLTAGRNAKKLNKASTIKSKIPEYEPGIRLSGVDETGKLVSIVLNDSEMLEEQGGCIVGRHPDLVDKFIDQENFSRRQVRLSKYKNRYYIEDLNSTNGTYINGSKIESFGKKEITVKSKVKFGEIEFSVSTR